MKLKSLMSTHQLADILKRKTKIQILDCSFPFHRGSPVFQSIRIPNSKYFNIEHLKQRQNDQNLTLPTREQFIHYLNELNLNNTEPICVYDQHGIFSSPRAWFTLNYFSIDNVSILDGGLPKWIKDGYDVDRSSPTKQEALANPFDLNSIKIRNDLTVEYEGIGQLDGNIIDTRFVDTYNSGHIPKSKCIPFRNFVTKEGSYKTKEEIEEIIFESGVDLSKQMASSCAVGLSACIGFYAVKEILKNENIKLYNGSYAEYHQRQKDHSKH